MCGVIGSFFLSKYSTPKGSVFEEFLIDTTREGMINSTNSWNMFDMKIRTCFWKVKSREHDHLEVTITSAHFSSFQKKLLPLDR